LGAIDRGTLHLTNRRVLFTGPKQTREVVFAKLVGFRHDQQSGSTAFAVSNRQKPVTVDCGSVALQFRFHLDLALADYRGTREVLVRQLLQRLAELDATRPLEASP
jgi:hypothetical protein